MLQFLRIYSVVISLLLLLAGKTYTQNSNFLIKKYTVDDGLPDNYILSIYQDSQGFLWIGTNNGLSRFDGKNFNNYGSRHGLTNMYVNQVLEDSQKRLWVGTRNNIFQFLGNKFIESPFNDIEHVKHIFDIVEIKNGELWALTDNGTYLFQKDRWLKKSIITGFDKLICRQICETSKGIYLNYGNIILLKQNNHTKEIAKYNPVFTDQIHFNNITVHQETLYATTRKGIYQLTDKNELRQNFKTLVHQGIWINILIDSKKRFWISQNSYPVYVATKENSIDSLLFNSDLISGFFEDKDQNIWIASDEGLLKVQNTSSIQFNQENNKLIEDIRLILETPDKKILAFSRENGILMFSDNNFKKAPFQFTAGNYIAAKNDFPDSYTNDEQENTWLATREGRLFCLQKNQLQNHTDILNKDPTLAWICYNKAFKKIFFSCDTLKLETNNILNPLKIKNSGKPIVLPAFVHCFNNGKSIISSRIAGVALLDTHLNYFNINKQLGLNKGINPTRFYEEEDGSFWMYGNDDGIKHFVWNKDGFPQENIHITSEDGLPATRISDMVIDKKNHIWVSSLAGAAYIQIDRQSKQVQVFPMENNNEIMLNQRTNSKLLLSHDEKIWLAGSNSIYVFDPNKISLHKNQASITIQDLQVNLKPTNWDLYTKSLTNFGQLPVNPILGYKENNLQISFSGSSFIGTHDFLYSYHLNGIDDSWSIPNSRNYVVYTNLSPGKYVFSVKGKTKSSTWSKPISFTFQIKPPFWNTWWFRLLIIITAAYLINRIYQNQIKKIKHKAAIQQQVIELEMTALKSQMNPHFIYNALGSIQSLVVSDKKEEAVFYIGTFARLLRQVLEQSEYNVITLSKELETLRHYIALESLRLNMEINYIIHIDDEIDDSYEKIPPLILQPFVENCLWHGLSNKKGEKKITINISAKNKWLICSIEDNGIGRQKAEAAKSLSSQQHKSKATGITTKRLIDYNQDKNLSPVEYKDLFEKDGFAIGTQVIINIRRDTV